MDLRTKLYKKTAYLGLFTSLAIIFSYVEFLIPFNFGIPGIKLGLANGVIIIALYLFGYKEAYLISVLRVILSSLLFGNVFGFLYSITGALLSLMIMSLLKKINKFSIVGISMTGGVVHNAGQLIVAVIIVHQINVFYYGYILALSGLIMGLLIGLISSLIYKRVETYVRL